MHSALDAVRDIVVASWRTSARPAGPLMYLGPKAGADLCQDYLEADGAGLPIEWKLEEDGDLSMFYCHVDLVCSPMFRLFFMNMLPGLGPMHTEGSLKLLETHLGHQHGA